MISRIEISIDFRNIIVYFYIIILTQKLHSVMLGAFPLLSNISNLESVAWSDITIVIAIIYNSVLKEGRRQTFPLSMSLAQKPPNTSN
jgi:hypothetical protein